MNKFRAKFEWNGKRRITKGMDAPPDSVTRFEYRDFYARFDQPSGRRQSGDPRPTMMTESIPYWTEFRDGGRIQNFKTKEFFLRP